jgi:hypothetical protein
MATSASAGMLSKKAAIATVRSTVNPTTKVHKTVKVPPVKSQIIIGSPVGISRCKTTKPTTLKTGEPTKPTKAVLEDALVRGW